MKNELRIQLERELKGELKRELWRELQREFHGEEEELKGIPLSVKEFGAMPCRGLLYYIFSQPQAEIFLAPTGDKESQCMNAILGDLSNLFPLASDYLAPLWAGVGSCALVILDQ